ncbi:MAG: M16 family metallopeptidase, partial [Ignavibacterium sp.]
MNNSIIQSIRHSINQSFIQSILILFLLSPFSFAQFKLPHYEVVELKNGLTIYLMEKKDVPLISFAMSFDAGAVKDGLIPGLASFTSAALKFGTANYSKSQIDSLFNFYGSELSTSANYDYAGMFIQIMKDNFETLLPVLSEVILKPTFPSEEIDKRKQRWLAELDQAKESPRRVIGDYFNKLIFEDGIYSTPLNGTKSSIQKVDEQKIKEFYSLYYRPETSSIAVVGDFDTDKMKSLLERYFGSWQNNSPKIISDIQMNQK